MSIADEGLALRKVYAIAHPMQRSGYVEEAPENELRGALDAIYDAVRPLFEPDGGVAP